MATRLYFSTNAAVVTPGWGAWSENSGLAPRQLTGAKDAAEVLTETPTTDIDGGDTLGFARFVCAPVAAQTISGTVKLQAQARDLEDSGGATSRLLVKVVSGDGSTVRGTLLALDQYGPATAFNASYRNKIFADGDALSNVSALEGDRLVVEIGAFGSGDYRPRAKYGAPTGSDLPENETETGALVPWIEFSGDISFQSGGSGPKNLLLLGVG